MILILNEPQFEKNIITVHLVQSLHFSKERVCELKNTPVNDICVMNDICGIYERGLRELNPTTKNLTYDITNLYKFIYGHVRHKCSIYDRW